MLPLRSARHLASQCLREALRPGDHAVDATMGNGQDTLLLAQCVGPAGCVDAFDIQPLALSQTRMRLAEAGCLAQTRLHLAGHETLRDVVQGPVQAIAFNLGWLPGGDKGITTRVETTRLALEASLALLAPGGVLSVCVYPGHEEGAREAQCVRALLSELRPQAFNVLWQAFVNASPGAPEFFLAQKQPIP